jgi:hypothetical protein
LLAGEWGLQTDFDIAVPMDTEFSFSCEKMALLGNSAEVVEATELVANVDSGARVKN